MDRRCFNGITFDECMHFSKMDLFKWLTTSNPTRLKAHVHKLKHDVRMQVCPCTYLHVGIFDGAAPDQMTVLFNKMDNASTVEISP